MTSNPTSTHEEIAEKLRKWLLAQGYTESYVEGLRAAELLNDVATFALQVQADAFKRAAEIARKMGMTHGEVIAQAIEREATTK